MKNIRLKKNLIVKAHILTAVREFFRKEGFLEMDTPTLVAFPDPSPFNELFESKSLNGERLFLTPSPEFFLKKLLAAGFRNIYEITKAYRDQSEKDSLHLREFTILEWYRDNADYFDLMRDCENLVRFVWERLSQNQKSKINLACPCLPAGRRQTGNQNYKSKFKINYQGREIYLTPPWMRISCKEAFKKYAHVDLDEFLNLKTAQEICLKKGYQIAQENTWEELYHQVFLNEVEPKLLQLSAVILYDYPAPQAALSKLKKSDPNYAERFEFYLGGLEIGNGYSELTDWEEQEKRLKKDIETRMKKGMKVFDYDHDFIEALKKGVPKSAGIAVGVDRLCMLFTNSATIQEITPFTL